MASVRQFLRAMTAIIWKDLAAEWRSREMISVMLVFALAVPERVGYSVVHEFLSFLQLLE